MARLKALLSSMTNAELTDMFEISSLLAAMAIEGIFLGVPRLGCLDDMGHT